MAMGKRPPIGTIAGARFAGILICALYAAFVWAQSPVDAAKRLFEQYVALGHAYDARLADLYADEATIRNKRTYPTGEVREMTVPAPDYKAVLRQVMPLARTRGDRSAYSEVRYIREGERVRIH